MNPPAVRTLAAQRMLKHRCGRCLAEPDDWCRTARGSRAAMLHSARFYAAQAAGDLPLTEEEVGGYA